jgi:tetratricopeptide (TPR) repeat protein
MLLALLVSLPAPATQAQEAPAAGSAADAPVAADAASARTAAEARAAVYEEFRRDYSAGRYAEALPRAQELVTLLERDDPLSDELPTAYNNLGVVQVRTGDLAGAEASFGRALELLEQTQGIASRRLVSPLAGLGAVYAAQGQNARAVDVLQRAVGISRRADGLFNLGQLDLLDAIIRSYESLGVLEGIERELRYQLQVVQKEYGADDARTVPIAMKLATWYERTNRYAGARALWTRIAEIGLADNGGRNVAAINGLLGIARTHRLQYARDPGSIEGAPPVDPLTGRVDPMFGASVRPNALRPDPEGEAAAVRALGILDATPNAPGDLQARTLIELGDWYLTSRDPGRAMPHYERAWSLVGKFLAPGEANPLLTPRPILYRPPVAAVRNRGQPDTPTVARKLEFNLDIAATGEVTAVTPVSSEVSDSQTQQVRRALEKAWFSPRFEDGKPVATTGFLFAEYWFEIAPPAETETGKPGGTPAGGETPAETPATPVAEPAAKPAEPSAEAPASAPAEAPPGSPPPAS